MGLWRRLLRRPKKKRARIQSAPPARSKDLVQPATQQLQRASSSPALPTPVDGEQSNSLPSLVKRSRPDELVAVRPPTLSVSHRTAPVPISSLSRRLSTPSSPASELTNARAGTILRSSLADAECRVEEFVLEEEGSKPTRRLSSEGKRTPLKPLRDDSLEVIDLSSPPPNPSGGSKPSSVRPALRELDASHNARATQHAVRERSAPAARRRPADQKGPKRSSISTTGTSSPAASPRAHRPRVTRSSLTDPPQRAPVARKHCGLPDPSDLPSTGVGLGAAAAGPSGAAGGAGPRPRVWDGAPPIAPARQITKPQNGVAWVGADVGSVLEVERVDKAVWGEAAADYKKNMQVTDWHIQDIVLFMGFCARIHTILCAPTLV